MNVISQRSEDRTIVNRVVMWEETMFLVFNTLIWYNMNYYYKILYCPWREICLGFTSCSHVAVSIVVIIKKTTTTYKLSSIYCNKSQAQIIGYNRLIKKDEDIAQPLQPQATLFKSLIEVGTNEFLTWLSLYWGTLCCLPKGKSSNLAWRIWDGSDNILCARLRTEKKNYFQMGHEILSNGDPLQISS